MEVFEAIKARRSVRAYDSRPIPDDVLMKILEAGRLAPSAANFQPWHFIVVTDSDKRRALSRPPFARFLKESPAVIVACGNKDRSPNWYIVDVSIAVQQMVLTATSEGLGTCWIGGFNKGRVRDLLGIPDKYEIIALIAIGHPREKIDVIRLLAGTKRRKKIIDIASFNKYGNPPDNTQRTLDNLHPDRVKKYWSGQR